MPVKINRIYVEHLLLNRNMTSRDLAKATGLGEATVYNVMAGKSFSSDTLGILANFLRVPAEDLISNRPVRVTLSPNGHTEPESVTA